LTLFFADRLPRKTRLPRLAGRSKVVLKQLSFLEDPLVAGEAPVWTALDENQRAETVAKLGYLIAKVATWRHEPVARAGEEPAND
jgi:hypothetical protein